MTAVLILIGLLTLTGCRVQPAGEGGETARPTQTSMPSPSPTVPPPPTPSHSVPPSGTEEPSDESDETQTILPGPLAPAGLDGQTLAALVSRWCGEYRDRFAGYEALRLDREYWFADGQSGAVTVPYMTAGGVDAAIAFGADETGETPVAELAHTLLIALGADASSVTLVDRTELEAALAAEAAAVSAADETEALGWFFSRAAALPALGEGMWLCTDAAGTDYLLLRLENRYRLQRMDAMLEYAGSPRLGLWMDYDRAVEAYGWFELTTLPLEPDTRIDIGERSYYRVAREGITTLAELRSYLKTLFSDEIVDRLLPAGQDRYVDIDGRLFGQEGGRGEAVVRQTMEVRQVSETRLILHIEAETSAPGGEFVPEAHTVYEFPYERVGERWVFTEFALTV